MLFEDDTIVTSSEHQESKHRFRHSFYSEMLEMPYPWAPKPKDGTAAGVTYGGDVEDTEEALPELPAGARVKLDSKGYVAPTDFDPEAAKPFGNLLDEPLG